MDKISKRIMKYLSSKEQDGAYICRFDGEEFKELADSLRISTSDLRRAINWLESEEILEYQRYSNGSVAGFYLSHIGANWRYFRRKEIIEYLEEKWIDFFSLLAALAALVISIISLLSKE